MPEVYSSEDEFELDNDEQVVEAAEESAEDQDENMEQDSDKQQEGKTELEAEKQRQSRQAQKLVQKQRKQSLPNSDIIETGKQIWNQLRQKTLPEKTRKALMEEMMTLVTGKAKDIIFKHDASRIVQCCLKYGSSQQRNIIGGELQGSYVKLSQAQYSRFLVSRVLKYCSLEIRNSLIREFYGSVRKLVRHKEASVCLDEAYQFATPKQRTMLLQEFYGPEFALFKDDAKSLETLLIEKPLKKTQIMQHIRQCLDTVLTKQSFNLGRCQILHRVIHEYLINTPVSKDMIELLKDHLVHILHTREGSLIVQYVILNSTPKDRKLVIKSMKGLFHKIAREQHGYTVILSLLECCDDTVLLSKSMIHELFTGEFKETICDFYGSRVYLFLLTGRDKRVQQHHVLANLLGSDEVRKTTTKKDDVVRMEQLKTISVTLLSDCICQELEVFCRDRYASSVILHASAVVEQSVFAPVLSGLLKELKAKDQVKGAVQKLSSDARIVQLESQGIMIQEPVLVNKYGTTLLKNLIRQPVDSKLEWKTEFAKQVWGVVKSAYSRWVSYCFEGPQRSGTALVLVSLYESGVSEIQTDMKVSSKECSVLKTSWESLKAEQAKVEKAKSEVLKNQKTDKKKKQKIAVAKAVTPNEPVLATLYTAINK